MGLAWKVVYFVEAGQQHITEINNLDRIDFLKLDCEGSEFGIMFSTPQKYLRVVNKTAIEFHNNVTPYARQDLRKPLEGIGFRTQIQKEAKALRGYLYAWRD